MSLENNPRKLKKWYHFSDEFILMMIVASLCFGSYYFMITAESFWTNTFGVFTLVFGFVYLIGLLFWVVRNAK